MEQSVLSCQGPGGVIGEAGHPREIPLGLAATTLLRGKQTEPLRAGEGGRERHRATLQQEDCVPALPLASPRSELWGGGRKEP